MMDMDIEGLDPSNCFFDYLEIFDGDSENATQLATLCGDTSFMPAEPFYSTYNYMLLKFTSDVSIQGRGFKANYTTIQNSAYYLVTRFRARRMKEYRREYLCSLKLRK